MPTIQHLAERKFKITGKVYKVDQILPVKSGFKQKLMIHIPGQSDNMTGKVIRREQFYWVEIYSKEPTDKRFLSVSDIQKLVCCSVYLNSYHWIDNRDGLTTVIRLSFNEWLDVENTNTK